MTGRLCPCCNQPMPIACIVDGCDAATHHHKSKVSPDGRKYRLLRCDMGHTTVVLADGATAARYSRALETVGCDSDDPRDKWRRNSNSGRFDAIRPSR